MKEHTKVLIKAGIVNCGIATAIINGIISYFSLPKIEQIASTSLGINFLSVALGCGLICPFFGGLILKGVSAKNPALHLERKSAHILARLVPDNLVLGAIMIGLLDGIILWGIPCVTALALGFEITLNRNVWVVIVGFYSGIAASFAAYFGMLRVYFAHRK